MNTVFCDVAVIGAGPAGLAAAVSAKRAGAGRVLVIERDESAGGILQQCIHPGFGLQLFREELTGPEYAGRFLKEAREAGVEFVMNTMVLELNAERAELTCVGRPDGMSLIKAKSVVLAMGCRERTRANLRIPGTRPAGIYTAGTAQRLLNRQNILVGRKVVILGSGDVGMIMARRLTLEGAQVKAVIEIMDYLAGLTRNKVQCLDDFGIPLKLRHTVTRIEGNRRVEGVRIAAVDENRQPVPGTEEYIPCDTLLLSVGLIPENELTRQAGIRISPVTNGPEVNQFRQTAAPAVFSCGNVLHVNDLVDNVTAESALAGECAALHAAGRLGKRPEHRTVPGENVRYLCPQRLSEAEEGKADLFFRVLRPDRDVTLRAVCGETVLAVRKERRVSPGEMCRLSVPLEKVNGDVRVEVVKEG